MALQSADAPERLEVVLADGQSTDNPQEVVDDLKRELSSYGTTLKIVSCERGVFAWPKSNASCNFFVPFASNEWFCVGRGTQLNKGAQVSRHKLLLFLHADTIVPRHFDTLAWHTLVTPGKVAGVFKFGLDAVLVEELR